MGLLRELLAVLLAGVAMPVGIQSVGQGPAKAVIGLVPDPQNYCSTQDPDLYNSALAMAHLDAQVNDIIALHPDFVIVLGDLTDSTGGTNESLNTDDTSHFGTVVDTEWQCFRTRVYDRLIAAGVRVFLIFGNHDSCVDAERWFPKTEWLAYPYARNAESGIMGCSADLDELTEQRTAIMPTPIGDICVVGADYAARSNFTTEVMAYVNANVGCGSDLPTIVARHSAADSNYSSGVANSSWMTTAGNEEIFATAEAHFVTSVPMTTTLDPGPLTATLLGFEFLRIGINMQEVSPQPPDFNCNNPAWTTEGYCMHTGVSWWATLEIIPSQNRMNFQPRAPFYKGRHDSHYSPLYTVGNKSMQFATPWCTRFPGGPAC